MGGWQFRIDRQGQDFRRRSFGFRQVTFLISQILETLLQMQWMRVIDFAPHTRRGQVRAELVASSPRNADRILIPNVIATVNFDR